MIYSVFDSNLRVLRCSLILMWRGLIIEHLNTRASSFHKHLIKCKNNDNYFSIKIKAIVRNVGNLRIKEALSIAKLHPQINCRLESDIRYH